MDVRGDAAVDPWGRICILWWPAWAHIVSAHPEMAAHRDDVLAIIRAPDFRAADPVAGRWRYFGRGRGPSRWIRVVVDCSERYGIIVTAFPERRGPRR